jgi:molybdenum cofactor cytidylyltransferase
MNSHSQFRLGAVLLAAGASSRMGKSKPLLRWDDNSVIEHLIRLWKTLATQVSVVIFAKDQALATELDRLQISDRVLNQNPECGMFSSIQCAAAWRDWRPELTHWAIVLGDQPHLSKATLSAVVQFANENPDNICQASRRGRPRHPVILPRAEFLNLVTFPGATLKDFLSEARDRVKLLELDDAALDFDIDRPEDYEAALRLFPPSR